jgi:hypothetical protein
MNRETLLFTNAYRLARSLNQRFCEAISSKVRVASIEVLDRSVGHSGTKSETLPIADAYVADDGSAHTVRSDC